MTELEFTNEKMQQFWPQWRLAEEIGDGSHGVVYRAESVSGSLPDCTVKVISIPRTRAELTAFMAEGNSEQAARAYFGDMVDSFVDEIRIMEKLRDEPNIVHILDSKVIAHPDDIRWDIYIRMELLESLYSWLSENRPDQAAVIRVGQDICQALTGCSALHIIHRDIKPENIFVDPDGHFKLGDFGVARRLEHKASALSLNGTYNYMAPEVYKGEGYTENADVYSLGIVLYRMMNHNRIPFLDPSRQIYTYTERMEAFEQRISGKEIEPPAEAGPALSAVILHACRYDPGLRYRSAAELKKALAGAAAAIKEGRRAEEAFALRAGRQGCPPSLFALRRIALTIGCAAAVFAAVFGARQLYQRYSGALETAARTEESLAQAEDTLAITEESLSQAENDLNRTRKILDDVLLPTMEEAGVTDHVIIWQDENLEKALREMLSESTATDIAEDGEPGIAEGSAADVSESGEDSPAENDPAALSEHDIYLSDLWELQDLDLTGCGIRSTADLAELQNLRSLILDKNDIEELVLPEGLTYLSLNDTVLMDLSGLSFLRKLQSLSLNGCDLSSLTDLQATATDSSSITGLSALSSLTGLTSLSLDESGLTDASALASLTGLEHLSVRGNALEDLSFVKDMTHLLELDAFDNRIPDISALTGLTQLETLYLGRNELGDDDDARILQPLAGLPSLRVLDLSENGLTSAAALPQMAGLEELYLGNNHITDITPLTELSSLTSLALQDNPLQSIDRISVLTSLVSLDLENTGIDSIEPLAALTELSYTDLSDNALTDISPLAGLSNLAWLDLSRNQLKGDLNALRELKDVYYLDVRKNQLTDISALQDLKALEYLYASDNAITDHSVLEGMHLVETDV